MPPNLPPHAVFLDRDGTLIENRHYLSSPDGVTLLPGVRDGLARALAAGAALFLFTNQSGVGRGLCTLADVHAVNARMIELLSLGENVFADICIATERPDEPLVYRKPSPRFIQESLARHAIGADAAWMIGDSPADWQAGLAAGINAAVVTGDTVVEADREIRMARGVRAFPSLLDWVRHAFG